LNKRAEVFFNEHSFQRIVQHKTFYSF